MSTGILDIIKRASLDAVENSNPCDLRYGTVISTSPLEIKITPQLVLSKDVLIVPKHLTDYSVKVSLNWETESIPNHKHSYSGVTTEVVKDDDDVSDYALHSHDYSGVTTDAGSHTHSLVSEGNRLITIHSSLKIGDMVALLRESGGQRFYILDRI